VKPILVEEEAELELAASVAFYERQRGGLGLEFEAAAGSSQHDSAFAGAVSSSQGWYQTLHYAPFSVYHLLPGNAGFSLDRCLRTHKPEAELLAGTIGVKNPFEK